MGIKFTGEQSMLGSRPPAFGVDSPQHQQEVLAYQAAKAAAMMGKAPEVQAATPAPSTPETPVVDISKFPPPAPGSRVA